MVLIMRDFHWLYYGLLIGFVAVKMNRCHVGFISSNNSRMNSNNNVKRICLSSLCNVLGVFMLHSLSNLYSGLQKWSFLLDSVQNSFKTTMQNQKIIHSRSIFPLLISNPSSHFPQPFFMTNQQRKKANKTIKKIRNLNHNLNYGRFVA